MQAQQTDPRSRAAEGATPTLEEAFIDENFVFGAETVLAYELGTKLTVAEGRAQLNVALFRSEFDDLQVTGLQEGITFSTTNAASAVSEGVEADIRRRPTQSLTLLATAAYLDAVYDDYRDAPCNRSQTVAAGCINGVQDLSGAQLTNAPKFRGNASGEYVWLLPGDLRFSAFVRVFHTDGFYFNSNYLTEQAYTKIDARLALARNADHDWEAALIGRNLTDRVTEPFGNDLNAGGFSNGSHFRFIDPPRAISLQATVRF